MFLKRLQVVIAALITLALIAGAVFVVIALKSLVGVPSDAYASDYTAIFVIEHLKSSNNLWPASWEDLRDEFDRIEEPTHYAWTFKELQERVDFRFDVTADQVRDSDSPLVVFRLASGRHVSYGGDPNLLIRQYLRTGQGGMESM